MLQDPHVTNQSNMKTDKGFSSLSLQDNTSVDKWNSLAAKIFGRALKRRDAGRNPWIEKVSSVVHAHNIDDFFFALVRDVLRTGFEEGGTGVCSRCEAKTCWARLQSCRRKSSFIAFMGFRCKKKSFLRSDS